MLILYLLTIATANALTAVIDPLVLLGGSIILPAGSLLAGATFFLRDFVQMKHGKDGAYLAIICAFLLSMAMSIICREALFVSLASLIAFLVSETIDTEVFTRCSGSLARRVLFSGIVGGTIDSAIFVIIGLSPMTTAVLLWEQVPYAVLGQTVAKIAVQVISAAVVMKRYKK